MVANIQNIIGKVNPKAYSSNGKELLKKYGTIDKIPAEEVSPKPLSEHKLVYDSSSETLEPIYFFILDLMNDFGLSAEKIVDNFSSSPGSGHFAELGQRKSIMQQQASKLFGDINNVVRSVLSVLYDLKEMRSRIQQYDDLNSKDEEKKKAARLALKQIWMDKVDITKGNSSLKAMSFGQGGYQTLIHAFLATDTEKDVEKVDLNDAVKRILFPRINEFNIWIKESERELRKRYGVEKEYLRSQVNSLKLYSRWAKPYLRAAEQLEPQQSKDASLVKVFDTLILQLTLLGKSKLKPDSAAEEEDLPPDFKKMKLKRDYHSCVVIDFKFRSIPQRVSQQPHYAFGGRAEITFQCFSLNQEELDRVKKELENSDLEDTFKLIEGATTESLDKMKDEINEFLEEKEEVKEEKKDVKKNENSNNGSNPFLALFGFYNKEGGSTKENKDNKNVEENVHKKIRPDDYIESNYLRPLSEKKAQETNFRLFDIYKKAHGMPSYT